MSDRTVHAESSLAELVRYDRAGKWFIEYRNRGPHWKIPITLAEAVIWASEQVVDRGVTVHLGQPGGRSFDRAVRPLVTP